MKYLLDSDIVISHLNGKTRPQDFVTDLLDEGAAMSLMSYAEVYEGIVWYFRPSRLEGAFAEFLRWVRVLGFDEAMMRRFAFLRGQLRRAGTPLSDADLLIASTALYFDLILVTRNLRHFNRVDGLKIYTSEQNPA